MNDAPGWVLWLAGLGGVMLLTSFAKITVVLALLRNALGAPGVPSAALTTTWAAALTLIVMAPIFLAARDASPSALAPGKTVGGALVVDSYQALEAAREPMRAFLVRHAAPSDVETFHRLAVKSGRMQVRTDDLLVVGPAFAMSEFREALILGLILMLPFLVLDVVAGVALSIMGLANVAVASVALPLKLLLFISIDGWRLVSELLVSGYFA